MRIANRLHVLTSYLRASSDVRMSLVDFVKNGLLKPPSEVIAPRFIERTEDGGPWRRVFIRGCSAPLFWPRELPLSDLHRVVTECCYEQDWHYYEVPETRVRQGDVVLDCGAAEGLFALRVMDRASRVVAFEPQPEFVSSMRAMFAERPHVTVEPKALGRAEGVVRVSGSSLTGRVGASDDGTEVAMTTIDAWRRDSGLRVDYLKADVEGFELAMLEGAVETIAHDRPRIAITVYHPSNDWRAMRSLLARQVPGYRFRVKGVYRYDGVPVRPVMMHVWV